MRLHIPALALASAIIWSGAVLLVATANLIWPSYGGAFLILVDSVYPGYHAGSGVGSVVIGTLYAALDGILCGAVFALLYNTLAGCCSKRPD